MLNSRYDDLKSGKGGLSPAAKSKPTSAKRAPPASFAAGFMTEFLSPGARLSDEIWEFIRANNLDAAGRVIGNSQRHRDVPSIRGWRPDPPTAPRFILVREYLIAYAPEEKPLCGSSPDARQATRASWPRS